MMDAPFRITRHVTWSRYVTVMTILVCLVFACVAFEADSLHIPVILFACIGMVMLSAFYYSPVAVTVDQRYITIRRLLTPKRIVISDVKDVRIYRRNLDVRIVGSGGFFGFYGWFKGRMTGRYFAYVGKWSDAFLVELESGRKYVISCNQPDVMVKSIIDIANVGKK